MSNFNINPQSNDDEDMENQLKNSEFNIRYHSRQKQIKKILPVAKKAASVFDEAVTDIKKNSDGSSGDGSGSSFENAQKPQTNTGRGKVDTWINIW